MPDLSALSPTDSAPARMRGYQRAVTPSAVLVAVLLVLSMSHLGCGAGGTAGTAIVTVEQAVSGEEGVTVNVQGYVVASDGGVVLASALMESYPPQAGGTVLPVKGLDMSALVGLTATTAESGLARVTWSAYPVVIGGVVDGSVLGVESVPRVVEAINEEVKVRFGVPVEPLLAGDMLWWAFDVTNLTGSDLELVFANGQTAEVVLSQGGDEKYRWSDGKAFVEVTRTVTVEPGGTVSYVLNDSLGVAPGKYRLTARVTASVTSGDAAGALPELTTTVAVR